MEYKHLHWYNGAIITIFIIIISFPFIDSLTGITRNNTVNESHVRSKRPEFSLNKPGLFAYYYNIYYNENFSSRAFFLKVFQKFKINILQISPDISKVIFGKEGWLFLGDNRGLYNALTDYRSTNHFTGKELKHLTEVINYNKTFLDSLNIKYYIAVAPNSHTIYPEYLPDNIVKASDTSRLDIFIDHVWKNCNMEVIDLKKDLLNNKDKELLYYKVDTHWNNFGAFIGYSSIMQKIKVDFPGVPVIQPSDLEFYRSGTRKGDLNIMIGLQQKYLESDVLFKEDFKRNLIRHSIPYKLPKFYSGNPANFYLTYDNKERDTLKILVFRDSFGEGLENYIPFGFEKSIFIWDRKVMQEIVLAEKPDLVLQLTVERHLDYLGTE